MSDHGKENEPPSNVQIGSPLLSTSPHNGRAHLNQLKEKRKDVLERRKRSRERAEQESLNVEANALKNQIDRLRKKMSELTPLATRGNATA